MHSEPPAADEEFWTNKLIERFKSKLAGDYPPGTPMRRDAHTKAHGCVRAEFVISDGLPDALRAGIFAEPRTYPAWIRFSSSANSVRSDTKRDVMGMAIKLLDVRHPSRESGPDQEPEQAQDFLLASAPTFMVRTLEEFYLFLDAFFGGPWRTTRFFLNPMHLRVLVNLIKDAKRYGSPFTARYWSMSPYRLGSSVVKYSARPAQSEPASAPRGAGPDYLRDAMKAHLAGGDARFDFMVQLRTHPQRMPIDDASVEWPEELSPFVKVATIRIPPEHFDFPERWTFAENLSYAPWHCLPDHEPLGAINRARKAAYQALSSFRHTRNGVAPRPPFW
jgi:hypothetical protein